MKHKVARVIPRRGMDAPSFVEIQAPCIVVEMLHHQTVEPEIGYDHEAIRWVEYDGMGMGARLPGWIDARAMVLNEGRRFAEASISRDGIDRYTAAHEIGDRGEGVRTVYFHMAGIGPSRRWIQCTLHNILGVMSTFAEFAPQFDNHILSLK